MKIVKQVYEWQKEMFLSLQVLSYLFYLFGLHLCKSSLVSPRVQDLRHEQGHSTE